MDDQHPVPEPISLDSRFAILTHCGFAYNPDTKIWWRGRWGFTDDYIADVDSHSFLSAVTHAFAGDV